MSIAKSKIIMNYHEMSFVYLVIICQYFKLPKSAVQNAGPDLKNCIIFPNIFRDIPLI